ncbi:MAG: class I SAM-dependent RNA methyltransferase [Anaerolineales bacterium]|jgi:putative N6-adenine-specific DNA methylase|nr:class I SAM-dependent RNA methyltransferase [Anaerolineales bacterium]
MLPYFAVSAPGLEALTALELLQLGLVERVAPNPGGVEFTGDRAALYWANLHLRTASRILVRLGDFQAIGFSELRKRASRLEWERFLKPGQPVALRVTCHKSRLFHSDAVAERVAAAIGDRLGRPSPQQKPDDDATGSLPQLVVVRLAFDHCTISLDSSGALLHRRGYRLATAKAPLRETLAAGLLLASAWDGDSPLLDPFCGSGTIPIEAASLALGRPPGRQRRFAFMDWPGFERPAWQALLAQADQASQRLAEAKAGKLHLLASDRDAGAIELAQANAARAGVASWIEFSCRAVSAIEPPAQPGWLVTNPPYGVRVSPEKDLRNLYAQLGNLLRARCPGWQVAILSSDRLLLGQIGLRLDTSLALVNGGVPVRLGRGRVDLLPTKI